MNITPPHVHFCFLSIYNGPSKEALLKIKRNFHICKLAFYFSRWFNFFQLGSTFCNTQNKQKKREES